MTRKAKTYIKEAQGVIPKSQNELSGWCHPRKLYFWSDATLKVSFFRVTANLKKN